MVVFFVLWFSFDNDFSNNRGQYNIIKSTPSPDGKNIAIVYTGWGGGAAGWTFLRTTVIPSDEKFEPYQNSDYVFDLKGGRDIETLWEDNDHLLVTYKYKPEKINPYLRVSRESYSRRTGINIRYIEKAK